MFTDAAATHHHWSSPIVSMRLQRLIGRWTAEVDCDRGLSRYNLLVADVDCLEVRQAGHGTGARCLLAHVDVRWCISDLLWHRLPRLLSRSRPSRTSQNNPGYS